MNKTARPIFFKRHQHIKQILKSLYVLCAYMFNFKLEGITSLTKILSIVFILSFHFVNAQKSYFQQEVNYDIEVTLDDVNHELKGVANIEYINNSSDELKEIYFHLWANAYKNINTAFAKQQIRNGSTKFFFAKVSEMGGYSDVRFLRDGQEISWSPSQGNIDVAYLSLNKAIPSGGKANFEIPFTIKIPNYFSRMGHVGQAYYISQWYPKPAVYDKAGWHPMPYLDQGEFYSEFGSFDVKITLPENYVVASTGTLQTESEINFLNKKINETKNWWSEKNNISIDTIPVSSNNTKTIHYKASNVHDFAWFTDKRFLVDKSQVELSSGKTIDTWAFYNPNNEEELWKKGTEYLNRSVKFYSDHVGEYPYPHATAVNNPFASAGAMEYPMITLVDQMGDEETLDIVITHEVGHNWFYGILGFNERDHAWMDEGMNSYYEQKYTQAYYPNSDGGLPKFLKTKGCHHLTKGITIGTARKNKQQASHLHSEEFTSINYGLAVYEKPAEAFHLLENYLGTEKFNELFQGFYETWKFKHPQPEDFKNYLQKEGGKELTWLFDGMLGSTAKTDYAILTANSSTGKIALQNKETLGVPFSISGLKDGKVVQTQWYEGFTDKTEVDFPIGEYDVITIDESRLTPDVNFKNNSIKTAGLFKKLEPLSFKFGLGVANPTRSTLYGMPIVGWNNYDRFMVGALLYNYDFLPKRVDFALAPMYSFESEEFVGAGNIGLNFYPESNLFQRISFDLNAKRFSYNMSELYGFFDTYLKIAPQLEFEFTKKTPTSSVQQKLSFRYVYIQQNFGRGLDTLTLEFEELEQNYGVLEAKYTYDNNKATSPYKITATVQQGTDFTRLFANGQFWIPYKDAGKGARIKTFAGILANFDNPTPDVKFKWSGQTGFNVFQNDYLFDEILFGRNEREGLWSQQIFNRDAGLKTLSNFGSSTDWMVGFGVSTTVPGPIPVRPYIDATIYQGFTIDGEETLFGYSGGFSIVAVPDILEIYVPVFKSSSIRDSLTYVIRDTFLKRISFLFDLNQLKRTVGKSLDF